MGIYLIVFPTTITLATESSTKVDSLHFRIDSYKLLQWLVNAKMGNDGIYFSIQHKKKVAPQDNPYQSTQEVV